MSSGVGGADLANKALRVLGMAAAQAGLTAGYISLLAVVGERLCESMRTELFDAIMRQVRFLLITVHFFRLFTLTLTICWRTGPDFF